MAPRQDPTLSTTAAGAQIRSPHSTPFLVGRRKTRVKRRLTWVRHVALAQTNAASRDDIYK